MSKRGQRDRQISPSATSSASISTRSSNTSEVMGNSSWLKYENQLLVDVPPTSYRAQLDKMMGQMSAGFGISALHRAPANDADTEATNNERPETQPQTLRSKLDKIFSPNDANSPRDPFSTDSFIADPYSVGDAMPPSSKWIAWAINLADNYSERTRQFTVEFGKGCELNKKVLTSLEKKTREGYVGSRAYIYALNFLLHDAFARCSLPLPPGINLDVAIELRGGEPLYKAQMRSWNGYRMRVLGMIEMINTTVGEEQSKKGDGSCLPDILPARKLEPIPANVVRSFEKKEAAYPIDSDCDDEY